MISAALELFRSTAISARLTEVYPYPTERFQTKFLADGGTRGMPELVRRPTVRRQPRFKLSHCSIVRRDWRSSDSSGHRNAKLGAGDQDVVPGVHVRLRSFALVLVVDGKIPCVCRVCAKRARLDAQLCWACLLRSEMYKLSLGNDPRCEKTRTQDGMQSVATVSTRGRWCIPSMMLQWKA
jgi:hypothetical protein